MTELLKEEKVCKKVFKSNGEEEGYSGHMLQQEVGN